VNARPVTAETPALDGRLIDRALEILEREGLDRLSLRRIARREGVSHGAPLRHFRSLADLLSEVAARGFRRLSGAIESASSLLPTGAGAQARLRAAGQAYVETAVANRDLFALMFRPGDFDPANPRFQAESRRSFELLVRHVRDAQEAGFEPERDTRLLAGCVWAAAHGLATLWAQGALPNAVPEASLDDALATTLDLMLSRPEGAIS